MDNITVIEQSLTQEAESKKLVFTDGTATYSPDQLMDRNLLLPIIAILISPEFEAVGYVDEQKMYDLATPADSNNTLTGLVFELAIAEDDTYAVTILTSAMRLGVQEIYRAFSEAQGSNWREGDDCYVDLEALGEMTDRFIQKHKERAA